MAKQCKGCGIKMPFYNDNEYCSGCYDKEELKIRQEQEALISKGNNCTQCNQRLTNIVSIKDNDYCPACAYKLAEKACKDIIVTTTNNVDGFKVKKYIDIDSVEIVVGTGIFSECQGAIADILGTRSTMFEQKIKTSTLR